MKTSELKEMFAGFQDKHLQSNITGEQQKIAVAHSNISMMKRELKRRKREQSTHH